MRLVPVATALLAILVGCGSGPQAGDASPTDAPPAIDAPGDAVAPLTWVDFAVDGCPGFDPETPACRGTPPLTLRFTAIAPGPIEAWIWSFGDETAEDMSAAPEHTFLLPGSYTITLAVGGPGGTASVAKEGFVVVDRLAAGGRCSNDTQCEVGLTCLCAGDAGCSPSLQNGICARECGAGCDPGTTCARLGSGSEPWRGDWCLAECDGGAACAPGLACRELAASAGGWTRGCFAGDVLADVGGSCAAPDGTLDGGRCSSGSCGAFGALGLCGLGCTVAADCPSIASCALFDDGSRWCLARCGAAPCSSDPWLGCEAPGGPGELGFAVPAPVDPLGYCAPRSCTSPADCGLEGSCVDRGGGSFCGP